MSVQLREYEAIKLELLHALARSQRALASMAEHLAKLTHTIDSAPDSSIAQHLESMSAYQHKLAEHILRIKLRKIVQGKPGCPWINHKQGVKP